MIKKKDMVYQTNKIIQDVRIRLDENRTDEALLSNTDEETLKLDEIIRSNILEAVRRVQTAAPYWLLEQGHNFQYDDNNTQRQIFWEGDNDTCGWLVLPNDFMRMVVFEMSDWERPSYNALSVEDPDYVKQRSRVKGIRGSWQRPVVVIGVRPVGKVLEFYSCKSRSATVSKAVYIPYPSFDDYGGVDISERCYDAMIYTLAAMTLTNRGESEQAKNYYEQANIYLSNE